MAVVVAVAALVGLALTAPQEHGLLFGTQLAQPDSQIRLARLVLVEQAELGTLTHLLA
jgi:hypothetical protein